MVEALQELFKEHELRILYLDMPEIGFYIPELHAIVLNVNLYNENKKNFAAEHELKHFVEGHKESHTLYSSKFFHRKFKKEANKIAIEILVDFFVENELTYESQFVLDRFMLFYSIPQKLRNLCDAICREYFTLNTNIICVF